MSKRKRKNRIYPNKKNKVPIVKLERCCCEEEANQSLENRGLVLKFNPHHNNPKWIAFEGTRPTCKELGKRDNYSNKLLFEMNKEEFDNFKEKLETKENEEGSFAVPPEIIEEFNKKISNLKSVKLDRKNKRKRRKR